MKIVSACLAGINCRYDGTSRPHKKIMKLVKEGQAIPVCPEQLGGLSTPRAPAEMRGGRVITKNRVDVTSNFERGAQEVLRIAKLFDCKEAILKSNSPSCGCGEIPDGTFSGKLTKGNGVTAALLKLNGIEVKTEKEI